ncbi:MAG: DNA starvation/stationary phase protection protein [Proteobacteria bacterium]|nr:DNA starvation/stationary phase protection protein [Pseudomonadota bacterium]
MAVYHSGREHPELIAILTAILADTAVIYYKTHAFHWNVEGPQFYSLHLMLETFYQTLWESQDEIAERIRALGGKAPPSYTELLGNASIKEADATPASHIIVKNLRDDYLSLAQKNLDGASFAENEGDLVTANMLTEKATFLEKAAWMLHSSFTP